MSIVNFKILSAFMSWLWFRIGATFVIAPGRLDAFSQLSRLQNTKQVSLLEGSSNSH